MAKNVTKISTLNVVSMITLAVIIDGAQMATIFLVPIPAVGIVAAFLLSLFLTIIASISFFIWFMILGVKLSDRIPVIFITGVLEVAPFASSLPAWTVFVIATIFVVNRKAKYNEKKNNENV